MYVILLIILFVFFLIFLFDCYTSPFDWPLLWMTYVMCVRNVGLLLFNWNLRTRIHSIHNHLSQSAPHPLLHHKVHILLHYPLWQFWLFCLYVYTKIFLSAIIYIICVCVRTWACVWRVGIDVAVNKMKILINYPNSTVYNSHLI